ncbi:helix-turn-helix transcriptional regulator [Microlunatus sp. Y2014]|uniref:helix-turn-helix transcriptional regulator n=1 Tax=Microlunatus sp. Y2014 TaxID=3418488 RepID=UPI003DA6CFF1
MTLSQLEQLIARGALDDAVAALRHRWYQLPDAGPRLGPVLERLIQHSGNHELRLLAVLHEPTSSYRSSSDQEIAAVTATVYDQTRLPEARMVSALLLIRTLSHLGRFDEAVTLGVAAGETVSRLGSDPSATIRECSAMLHFHTGATALFALELSLARRQLRLAYQHGTFSPRTAADAAAMLALISVLEGTFHTTDFWVSEAERWSPADTWATGFARQIASAAKVISSIDRLDWGEYTRGLLSLKVPALGHGQCFFTYAQAQASLHLRNHQSGIERLQEHRREYPHQFNAPTLASVLFDTVEADLWMALGRFGQAEDLVTGGHPAQVAAAARLHLLTHDYARALDLVGLRSRPDNLTPREEQTFDLIQASAELATGRAVSNLTKIVTGIAADPEVWQATLSLIDPALIEELRLHALRHALHWPRIPFVYESARLQVPPPLSPRELVVLERICAGLTEPEIAETLHVTLSTIKNQRNSLYRKLGANDRQHAMSIARYYKLDKAATEDRSILPRVE